MGEPGRSPGCGQVNAEGGALALLGFHVDDAAEARDYAVHGRESQPGAGAGRLGGEEALENPGTDPLAHSGPRIGNGEFDVTPLAGRAGTDRQRAAASHRVPRVDGQVKQYLLELTTIREHRGQI